MSGSAALSLSDIHGGYRGKPVLHGVSISGIEPGQILALTGQNAAGKSTGLKAISGFLPVSGRVTLGHEDVTKLTPFQRAGKISYMPQTLPRGVGLNVFESVVSALRIAAKRAAMEIDQPLEHQAVRLIERLDLGDIALSDWRKSTTMNVLRFRRPF